MNKPIPRRIHGLLDYAYVTAVAHLPEMIGFHKNKNATKFFRALSATVFTATAATRAEWGAVKIISYKKHLVVDAVLSTVAIAAPWLLGFSNNKKATATSVALGFIGYAVVALSEPENMPVTKDAYEGTKEKVLAS